MSAATLVEPSTTPKDNTNAIGSPASSTISDQPNGEPQATRDTAGPTTLPPPKPAPQAKMVTAGAPSDDAHHPTESQNATGVVNPSDQPNGRSQAKRGTAGPNLSPPTAPIVVTKASVPSAPSGEYDRQAWMVLRTLAEALDDAQQARIAIANKLRRHPVLDLLIEGPKDAEDGLAKALKLHYRKVVPKPIRDWQKESGGVGEHLAARLLGQIGHPIIATPSHWEGTGSKRVLVADPAFDRSLRQLWQYAGHGDPERSRRVKGATAEQVAAAGQPKAKMLVHLIAECAIKQPGRRWTPERGGHWATDTGGDVQVVAESQMGGGVTSDNHLDDAQLIIESHAEHGVVEPSPHAQPAHESQRQGGVWKYRAVYEAARSRYTDRTHASTCVRCGPSGKPATEGSDWSLSHQHAAALRLVGKEILRDLWVVAGGATEVAS